MVTTCSCFPFYNICVLPYNCQKARLQFSALFSFLSEHVQSVLVIRLALSMASLTKPLKGKDMNPRTKASKKLRHKIPIKPEYCSLASVPGPYSNDAERQTLKDIKYIRGGITNKSPQIIMIKAPRTKPTPLNWIIAHNCLRPKLQKFWQAKIIKRHYRRYHRAVF